MAIIHLVPSLPTGSSSLPGSASRRIGIETGRLISLPYLALHHEEFTWPHLLPDTPVGSYSTVSPLPAVAGERSVFCGTFPRVTPGRCCRPPCPSEPGPSSAVHALTRSPGQLVRRRSGYGAGQAKRQNRRSPTMPNTTISSTATASADRDSTRGQPVSGIDGTANSPGADIIIEPIPIPIPIPEPAV